VVLVVPGLASQDSGGESNRATTSLGFCAVEKPSPKPEKGGNRTGKDAIFKTPPKEALKANIRMNTSPREFAISPTRVHAYG